jgi:hypothetical protein
MVKKKVDRHTLRTLLYFSFSCSIISNIVI